VHPDDVAGPVLSGDRLREARVDRLVEPEVARLERELADEVVEERPDQPVAEPLVVALGFLLGEPDRHELPCG
jgi:hypothetical protein